MSLQLLDIDHAYGRHQSLHGVCLTVEEGDRYGFLGHNGAGKTTTMRIALGLSRQSRGKVLVDGFDAARHPREARARMGGMIEITGFYPGVCGQRNLIELARLQGMDRRTARREADRVLEQVGLSAKARSDVGTYSQGMRQRLGLAQALLGRPRYVLLDEPTNGLDPEGIAELRAVLARLSDEGLTVLLSSHQLAEVAAVCTKIGVLKRGRMLLQADMASLMETAGSRYELAVDDAARADRCLTSLGLTFRATADKTRFVDLDGTAPAQLVRTLVEAEVGVERFAPRPMTLEEVYLGIEHREENPSTTATRTAPVTIGDPPARLAPRFPVLRVLRFELRRGMRASVLAAVALPAVVAGWRVVAVAQSHARDLEHLKAGTQFSMANLTAWSATALGLIAAVPAAVLVSVALGSQSIAGDFALGTLRNALLRPATRTQVVIGKALAVAVAAGVVLALATATAAVAATASFDFGDCFEMTKDEPESSLRVAAEDVAPHFAKALLSPLLPLLSFAALGFACGAVARRAVFALVLALGGAVALGAVRGVIRTGRFEAWLPSTHLPGVTEEHTSYLSFFYDLSVGASDAAFHFAKSAIAAPLCWIAACASIAILVLNRRHVP
ncbi:MAG: ATP-binding cassette domain-containing protein [Planctomycetota bacterium]